MQAFNLSSWNKLKIAIIFLLLSAAGLLHGQGSTYYYYYRVYLRDKGSNSTSDYTGEDLLSARALKRRQKAGIRTPDFRDIPVCKDYLNQISDLGYHTALHLEMDEHCFI